AVGPPKAHGPVRCPGHAKPARTDLRRAEEGVLAVGAVAASPVGGAGAPAAEPVVRAGRAVVRGWDRALPAAAESRLALEVLRAGAAAGDRVDAVIVEIGDLLANAALTQKRVTEQVAAELADVRGLDAAVAGGIAGRERRAADRIGGAIRAQHEPE